MTRDLDALRNGALSAAHRCIPLHTSATVGEAAFLLVAKGAISIVSNQVAIMYTGPRGGNYCSVHDAAGTPAHPKCAHLHSLVNNGVVSARRVTLAVARLTVDGASLEPYVALSNSYASRSVTAACASGDATHASLYRLRYALREQPAPGCGGVCGHQHSPLQHPQRTLVTPRPPLPQIQPLPRLPPHPPLHPLLWRTARCTRRHPCRRPTSAPRRRRHIAVMELQRPLPTPPPAAPAPVHSTAARPPAPLLWPL